MSDIRSREEMLESSAAYYLDSARHDRVGAFLSRVIASGFGAMTVGGMLMAASGEQGQAGLGVLVASAGAGLMTGMLELAEEETRDAAQSQLTAEQRLAELAVVRTSTEGLE